MLLLPEGQPDEAWEPYKKQRSFGNRGALGRKRLHCVYKLAVSVHPEGPATGQLNQGFSMVFFGSTVNSRYPKSTLYMFLRRHSQHTENSVVTLPCTHTHTHTHTQFNPDARPLPSATHSSSSTSHLFPFFVSWGSALRLACFYQKDERALPGILQNSNFFPLLITINLMLLATSPASYLSLSRSLSLSFSL